VSNQYIIFVQKLKEPEAAVKWQLILSVQQEAQLSRRNRAMLRVVKNIAVTRSYSRSIEFTTLSSRVGRV